MPKRSAIRSENPEDDVAILKLVTAHLPEIEAALAATRRLPALPPFLAQRYADARLEERRLHNRLSMIVMTIIFDSFLLVQIHTAPEIAALSAVLRLLVFSPLVFGFVILDLRGRLHKYYGGYITLLAVGATVISDILILLTHANNAQSLSDIRATPLILLATGVVMRLTPREVTINAVLSAASFIPTILFAACIPHIQAGPLILSEIAVATAAIMLNIQLESRDRRVFLLQISAAISRAALAERNRFLLEESQTDGLTGIANRRCFDETLAGAVRATGADGGQLGLILIDIDHFKSFNDHYGHQGGDDCLRLIADRASREIRAGDLIARYGGEEFAVILPAAPPPTAIAVAERIRAAIQALNLPHQGMGDCGQVTISLGVAVMDSEHACAPRQLIEAADVNLYAAKRGGRNRVCAAPEPPVMSPNAVTQAV